MQTTNVQIVDSTGKAVTADQGDDGVTLAAGTYYIDLGGPDIASAHFEWTAALAATCTFDSSNRTGGKITDVTGWGDETGLGTVTAPGAVAGTQVVHPVDMKAQRLRGVIVVTVQGKLLVLRRGGQ